MERPIANLYDWGDYSSWGRIALTRFAMCSTAIITRTDTTGKRDSRAVGRVSCRRLRRRRRKQLRPAGVHPSEEAHPDAEPVRSALVNAASFANADDDADTAPVAIADNDADSAS